jgi:uncharacterized protein YecT (DUF1311 family)
LDNWQLICSPGETSWAVEGLTVVNHPLRTHPFDIPTRFLLVVLACASGVLAQDGAACGSAKTTADMRQCENNRYQKAQQDLNTTYEKLMAKLDPIGKGKLQAAETAWVNFRKANADYLADAARGGTLAPLIAITVSAEMTEARTNELKKSLKTE